MTKMYVVMVETSTFDGDDDAVVTKADKVFDTEDQAKNYINERKLAHDNRNDGLCSARDLSEKWQNGDFWELVYQLGDDLISMRYYYSAVEKGS